MRHIYADLERKTQQLHEALKRKGKTDEFQQLFDISWVHHDSALEGMVYSYTEITAALENRILADVSHLSTYQEIRNHMNAIHDTRQTGRGKKVKHSVDSLKKLHQRLVYLNDGAVAGRYRKDIPIHRAYFHDIALPNKISYQLTKVLEWMNSAEVRDFHPIKLASLAHYELMQVFPFSEHSGKVARLVMNSYLLNAGLLPAVIHASDRQRYYESLKGQPKAFKQLVIESMDNSLNNALKFLQTGEDRRAAN